MRKVVALVLGIALGSNGVWMLAAPETWYLRIPGVAATGPANFHFIRDIGCAYAVTAACLVWLAVEPRRSWPAAACSSRSTPSSMYGTPPPAASVPAASSRIFLQ